MVIGISENIHPIPELPLIRTLFLTLIYQNNLEILTCDLQVENVIMAGMISGADIQARVNELEPRKRERGANQQICQLVTQYGLRLNFDGFACLADK